MNKTIKQAERYEAPAMSMIVISVQKCIATSAGGTIQGITWGDSDEDIEGNAGDI